MVTRCAPAESVPPGSLTRNRSPGFKRTGRVSVTLSLFALAARTLTCPSIRFWDDFRSATRWRRSTPTFDCAVTRCANVAVDLPDLDALVRRVRSRAGFARRSEPLTELDAPSRSRERGGLLVAGPRARPAERTSWSWGGARGDGHGLAFECRHRSSARPTAHNLCIEFTANSA